MIGYKQTQNCNAELDPIDNYSLEQCEEYLKDYPNGLSAEKVRERLKSICIVRNWTYEQCNAYLQSFPNGTRVDAVQNRMKQLSPNNNTNNAKTSYERKDDYSNKASNTTTNSYGEPTGIIVLKVLATIVLVALIIGMLVEMIRGDIKFQWHTITVGFVLPIGLIGKIWSGDLF